MLVVFIRFYAWRSYMQTDSGEQFAEWDDERYSTAIDRFDEQHQRLFGLVNDLYTAMDEGHSEEEVGDILRELERYTEYHFGDEEEFMQDCGYAMDCSECFYNHREVHEEFAEKVSELREKHENGEYVTMEVLGFVRDWLDSHIAAMNEDQSYGEYFQREVDEDYEYTPGTLRQRRQSRGDGVGESGTDRRETAVVALEGDVHDGGQLSVPDASMAAWFESLVERHGSRDATLVSADGGFAPRDFDAFVGRARSVAGGLLTTALEPGDRLVVAVASGYEWSVIDAACHLAGLVSVPVYPSFDAGQVQTIAESVDASGVVSDGTLGADLSDTVQVTLDAAALPTAEARTLPGLDADGDDPATVVFDVTASDPTGCVLTHRNLRGAIAALAEDLQLDPGAAGTCFLPLAHVYQRVATYALWETGGAVAYLDPDALTDELEKVQPEVVVGVPTVYQRLYGELQDRIGSMNWMKRKVAGKVTSYGRDLVAGRRTSLRYPAANRLVYSPLSEATGLGNVEYALCDGEPIDDHLVYFFRGFGVPIHTIYGAVETAGVGLSASSPVDGVVGTPMCGSRVAVSEDGEILLGGPQVTVESTVAVETSDDTGQDGWHRTGEPGTVGPDGTVRFER
jgi:hemerythrin-like metal-binding protein